MTNFLLPVLATLLLRTLRITWRGEKLPKRAVYMFWHGKMFAGWWSVRKQRPIALVSRSKDGNFLASVLAHWGYQLSRGSTKKQGMAALEEAIARVRTQSVDSIVITPDGPQGPYHRFKRGAFLAADQLALPLILLEIEYSRSKKLRSWDRFEVPLPFSAIRITATKIELAGFPETPDQQYAWINSKLHALQEESQNVEAEKA